MNWNLCSFGMIHSWFTCQLEWLWYLSFTLRTSLLRNVCIVVALLLPKLGLFAYSDRLFFNFFGHFVLVINARFCFDLLQLVRYLILGGPLLVQVQALVSLEEEAVVLLILSFGSRTFLESKLAKSISFIISVVVN